MTTPKNSPSWPEKRIHPPEEKGDNVSCSCGCGPDGGCGCRIDDYNEAIDLCLAAFEEWQRTEPCKHEYVMGHNPGDDHVRCEYCGEKPKEVLGECQHRGTCDKCGEDFYSTPQKQELSEEAVKKIHSIIMDFGGMCTANPNADGLECAKALTKTFQMPEMGEIIWPDSVLHSTSCVAKSRHICICGANQINQMLTACKEAVGKAWESPKSLVQTFSPRAVDKSLVNKIDGALRCCQNGDYVEAAHVLGEILKELNK